VGVGAKIMSSVTKCWRERLGISYRSAAKQKPLEAPFQNFKSGVALKREEYHTSFCVRMTCESP
jgi:hypothetical protein